jgi:glycosyltransferase involved in cell wall biosynthesis
VSELRVVIDGRALVGRRTGIGVHTAEIARRLDVTPPPLIATHAPVEDRSGIEPLRFRVDAAALGVQWQQLKLARVAREEGDVLWGPHGTLPLALKTPAVVTVHDLTSITMPRRHRLKTVLSFNLFIRRSLEIASKVAVVSKATADEVIEHFGVAPERIAIVPNGVDPFFHPAAEGQASLPFDLRERGYLLYVGTIEPRKGIGNLLDAWEQLDDRRLKLVICGSLGWDTTPILKRIDTHPRREEIIVSGYLDRAQLRELYRRCALFVYPSFYEGFGLPPLEAMACGAAVVTSDGGAIPEIVGEAAEIVPAGDSDALVSRIRFLLADEARRAELVARGVLRAAEFTWERSAKLMQGLLESAAGR